MEIKCNIKDYIGMNRRRFFRIPAYQRGYKWSVSNGEIGSPLEILCTDVIAAMNAGKDEYFIQGITGSEVGDTIDLIDGQQRTTTLFLILKELLSDDEQQKLLFHHNEFKLKYEIRQTSQAYLTGGDVSNTLPGTQDIYYFKQAQTQIRKTLEHVDREALKQYLLNNVMIFFTSIPPEQAANVFSMLNGAKAFMKTDELIKAEFLCKASTIHSEADTCRNIAEMFTQLQQQVGQDWEVNALRSMLARQWDKWLYWWNRPEVRAFFHADKNPMGLLLEFFCAQEKQIRYSNAERDVVTVFKAFQNHFIKDPVSAKNNFERLRKLQKQFEDIFNDPFLYNSLGLILETNGKRHDEAIQIFLKHQKDKTFLTRFTLLSLIGIGGKVMDQKEYVSEKIQEMFALLSKPDVYNDYQEAKEFAFRQLFRLNVEAASAQKIKFSFFISDDDDKKLTSFYGRRSLEHIWPKSKYADLPPDALLHSIGNLLFLYANDNSKFNDSFPEDKKQIYFDLREKLRSRCLLHTMSVFAYDNWSCENAQQCIENNQKRVLNLIAEGYKQYV